MALCKTIVDVSVDLNCLCLCLWFGVCLSISIDQKTPMYLSGRALQYQKCVYLSLFMTASTDVSLYPCINLCILASVQCMQNTCVCVSVILTTMKLLEKGRQLEAMCSREKERMITFSSCLTMKQIKKERKKDNLRNRLGSRL